MSPTGREPPHVHGSIASQDLEPPLLEEAPQPRQVATVLTALLVRSAVETTKNCNDSSLPSPPCATPLLQNLRRRAQDTLSGSSSIPASLLRALALDVGAVSPDPTVQSRALGPPPLPPKPGVSRERELGTTESLRRAVGPVPPLPQSPKPVLLSPSNEAAMGTPSVPSRSSKPALQRQQASAVRQERRSKIFESIRAVKKSTGGGGAHTSSRHSRSGGAMPGGLMALFLLQDDGSESSDSDYT